MKDQKTEMLQGTERCHLLDGRVVMDQPAKGYRVSIDAVLAAAAVPASPGETVLDAGAGTGAIGLCLCARVAGLSITAIERDPLHAELARRNIALNQRGSEMVLVEADLIKDKHRPDTQYDHVVSNPPYHHQGHHRQPPDSSRRAAGHMQESLEDWLRVCVRRLRSGGWLTLIHKATELDRIVGCLCDGCGSISITPVWARAESKQAKRIIVQARKASKGRAQLKKGLILHNQGNSYTTAAGTILRGARALEEEVFG